MRLGCYVLGPLSLALTLAVIGNPCPAVACPDHGPFRASSRHRDRQQQDDDDDDDDEKNRAKLSRLDLAPFCATVYDD